VRRVNVTSKRPVQRDRTTRRRGPEPPAANASGRRKTAAASPSIALPTDADTVEIRAAARAIRLTNLRKVFWPTLGLTKRDLLQYYADVAPALLPHVRERAVPIIYFLAGRLSGIDYTFHKEMILEPGAHLTEGRRPRRGGVRRGRLGPGVRFTPGAHPQPAARLQCAGAMLAALV